MVQGFVNLLLPGTAAGAGGAFEQITPEGGGGNPKLEGRIPKAEESNHREHTGHKEDFGEHRVRLSPRIDTNALTTMAVVSTFFCHDFD